MKPKHWMLGVLSLLLAGTLARAAEDPPAQPWPLWDGSESIAEYAKKVNLPLAEAVVGQTIVGIGGAAAFVLMMVDHVNGGQS